MIQKKLDYGKEYVIIDAKHAIYSYRK